MSAHISNTVVMKFGGTSVGSSERIGAVSKRVAKYVKDTGKRVVVVVSAMSGETDRLIDLAKKVSGDNYQVGAREYHQLVTAGEHASVALTAMGLLREGVKSKSLLANQIQIKTRQVYGQHLIKEIDAATIESLLDDGVVPVVAGFQGIDENGCFSSLGRGGTDTTAVAIAAALGSCECIIYTDVDGVYTALPSIVKKATKLDSLNYEEMLELANSGAKVLQARSVSFALKHRVPLVVASSFNNEKGTYIVEEYEGMEDAVVSGISCRADEAKLTLRGIPDKPGEAAKVFKILGDAEVIVDMIVQSQGSDGKADISFTVPQESAQGAYDALHTLAKAEMPGTVIEIDRDIAKLSVVGEGMRTHTGVASKMFEILGAEGINVQMITTSEIKISVAIQAKYSELAVRVLHEAFIENKDYQA